MHERDYIYIYITEKDVCIQKTLQQKKRESQSRTLVPHINEWRTDSSLIQDTHGADSLRKAGAVKSCSYFKTADTQTQTTTAAASGHCG